MSGKKSMQRNQLDKQQFRKRGNFKPLEKLVKTRAIFKFSAEFQEVSLNKNFLCVPNLEIQIIFVIRKFQEEPVVTIGDTKNNTETKFHQVLVTESKSYQIFM